MMESLGRGDVAPGRRREAGMGIFAQRNGRPMAAAAEGRPTCPLIWAFPYEELERARAEIRSP
jgi:hypothetical protein